MLPAFRPLIPPFPVLIAADSSLVVTISVLPPQGIGRTQKPQVLDLHYLLRQYGKCAQPHHLPPIRRGKQEGTRTGLHRNGYVSCDSYSTFHTYLLMMFRVTVTNSANLPSKTQLLILDVLIIFLQLLLLCIAYETSLSLTLPRETLDPLSPIGDTSTGMSLIYSAKAYDSTVCLPDPLDDNISTPLKQNRSVPVLHLRLRSTIRRILDPPPALPSSSDLPLPNTTPFIFPSAGFPIQIAFRTRGRPPIRREAADNEAEGGDRGDRRLPGGLDVG